MADKMDDVSPSVAVILGALGKGKGSPSKGGDPALAKFGKALRMGLESKDDGAIGQAVKDLIEYCAPDPEIADDEY
jgi:hypothetical protein